MAMGSRGKLTCDLCWRPLVFSCKSSLEIVSSVSSLACYPGMIATLLCCWHFQQQPSKLSVHSCGSGGKALEHIKFGRYDVNVLELVLRSSTLHSCRFLVPCWYKHILFQHWRVHFFNGLKVFQDSSSCFSYCE